jgi:hypothetical protein
MPRTIALGTRWQRKINVDLAEWHDRQIGDITVARADVKGASSRGKARSATDLCKSS